MRYEDGVTPAPRLTPRATTLLAQIDEALADATFGLATAAQADWVSAAADGYRALLDETARGLARLTAAVEDCGGSVLRHTRSSDDASGAAALEHYAAPVAPSSPTAPPAPDVPSSPPPTRPTAGPRWRAA